MYKPTIIFEVKSESNIKKKFNMLKIHFWVIIRELF